MGIESFFTLQNLTPGQATGGKDSDSVKNALSTNPLLEDTDITPGASFLDFILARIQTNPNEDTEGKTPEEILDAIAAGEIEDPVIVEIDRALDAAEVQRDADNIIIPISDGKITVDEINEGGTQLKIEQDLLAKEEAMEELAFIVDRLRDKLEATSENEDGRITVVNLTPAQLASIKDIAAKFEAADTPFEVALSEDEIAEIEDILIDIVAANITFNDTREIRLEDFADDPVLQNALALLIPRQQTQSVPALENSNGVLSNGLPAQASVRAQENIDALATRLNNLVVGAGEDGFVPPEGYQGNKADFDAALRGLRFNGDDGLPAANTSAQDSALPSPDLSMLQNLPLPGAGLGFEGLINVSTLDGVLEPYTTNLNALAPVTVTSFSSLITQSVSATTPHPATQQVAANIQRVAGSGGSQEFTIRLDPPELGRLKIDMNFAGDGLKTTITAERAETYLMFQRDAGSLDRLLQEMGLDTDGGVNFELAEHGFDFEGDNRRGGGHDQGGTGSGENAEEQEIIESSVMWQIDPQTGLTRYDFLA